MTKGEHIIANSKFTKSHIVNKHKISPRKITVIPRGVDMNIFNPKCRFVNIHFMMKIIKYRYGHFLYYFQI